MFVRVRDVNGKVVAINTNYVSAFYEVEVNGGCIRADIVGSASIFIDYDVAWELLERLSPDGDLCEDCKID